MIVSKKIEGLGIILKEELIFSLSDKEKYIEDFDELKEKGVINKNDEFEGETWIVTISKVSRRLNFRINEILFKRITKGRKIKLSFEEFDIALRRFVLEMIYNHTSLGGLTGFLAYVKSFLEKTSFLDIDKIENVKLDVVDKQQYSSYNKLMEVLKFMDYEIPIEYQELYDETEIKDSKTRKLPRFTSVFKFIDVVEKFKKVATEEELIRYYPVILWHSISFVIPLRPTELLITRYDCVFKKGDKFFIEINRTTKKGSRNKYRVESFDIENYYQKEEVEISESMYNEILKYREFLDKHVSKSNKEFLFSIDLYRLASRLKWKKGINEELITSTQLGHLIDTFYVDIIQNKFNINITERYSEEISELEGTNEISVESLVPYDSRHLAIINLILMGNEHYTVMKLAGHDKIKTTKGYYDHIEEYADAYSINYAKYLSGKSSGKVPKEIDALATPEVRNRGLSNWRRVTKGERKLTKVDGGYCSYHLQDFNPCYNVGGKHSDCNYFIEDKIETINKEIDDISNQLHSSIKALRELVNNAENITRFSEKYSVLTETIQNQMNKKALLAYKKESFEEENICNE